MRTKKEIKEYNRNYYVLNKNHFRQNNKKYYQKHKKEILENVSKNYLENREKKLKYAKEYTKKNLEGICKRNQIYANNHREQTRKNNNIWHKLKRKTDIHYKIRRNISNAVWCKLNRNRFIKKDRKIAECLPYTIDELKIHLEKQFTENMSWKNYGQWHIDHIIPDSSFKYESTKDPEFQKSWTLKNLQPLWAIDNIKKGAKIIKIQK